MGRNPIIALVVVTILAIGAAWMVTTSPSGRGLSIPEHLVPDLHERINEVASVRLVQGEDEIQLARKGGDWTLATKDGYPAKFEPVKQLILSVAELKPLEEKTSNPDLYDRIEVGSPEQGGAGLLVEFSDALGEPIAGVVLGKTGASAGFGSSSTRFARSTSESRSWLVEGRVDARLDPMTWIDREIVAIPVARVRAVRVEREGESVSIVKAGEEWTLQDVPEGRAAKGANDLRRVANALSYVGLADVRAGDVPEAATERVDTKFTTTNEVDVTVTTWKEGEDDWCAVALDYAPLPSEASEPTPEIQPEEAPGDSDDEKTAEEEIAELRKRVSGWVFKLDSFKAEAMRPTLESLTTVAEAAPGPAGPFPDVETPAGSPGIEPPPGGG